MRQDPPFLMRITTRMEQYRWDTFWDKEPETIAWIDSFEPNTVFWDVGANVGVYSLYAASLDRGIKVIAFEPHEANNKQLHLNRDENRFTMKPQDFQDMKICACAIGDQVCTKSLKIPAGGYLSGSSGAQIGIIEGVEGQTLVDVETVDHLAELYGPPDYLKIDIDGQELAVLHGAMFTLPLIRSVLIEVSSKSRQAVCYLMFSAGFAEDDRFNEMTPHSWERRAREGIDAENIVFTRR